MNIPSVHKYLFFFLIRSSYPIATILVQITISNLDYNKCILPGFLTSLLLPDNSLTTQQPEWSFGKHKSNHVTPLINICQWFPSTHLSFELTNPCLIQPCLALPSSCPPLPTTIQPPGFLCFMNSPSLFLPLSSALSYYLRRECSSLGLCKAAPLCYSKAP